MLHPAGPEPATLSTLQSPSSPTGGPRDLSLQQPPRQAPHSQCLSKREIRQPPELF